MKAKKLTLILAAILLPFLGVFNFDPPIASAANASGTVATEDVASLSPEEKLAKAKEDLTKALDLSLKKVDSLKARLNDLNFPELSREAKLKNEALKDLDGYAAYYVKAKEDLERTSNLDEVKDLAREVKEYRDTTYTSGMEKIVRFALVFYNEEVLGVANNRLDKIEADVKKLNKLGVIKESDFRGKLNEADKLLKEGANLQAEAKKIILVTATTEAGAEKSTAKDLIETSLNNVKTVYDIFLELNQSVKKALGL